MKRLERARRFLLGRGKALSLKVIPLAVLALPMFAITTATPGQFSVTNQAFSTLGNTGSGYFLQVSDPFSVSNPALLNVNGFQGVSLTGSVSFICCGTCAGDTIDMNFSGNVTPLSGNVLPPSGHLLWNFYAFPSTESPGTYGYSLLNTSGTGSYGSNVIGSGNFAISSGNFSVDLQITPSGLGSGDEVTITFPSQGQGPLSLDFTANPSEQAPATTPEPSTVALGLSGAAALAFIRRKRKA